MEIITCQPKRRKANRRANGLNRSIFKSEETRLTSHTGQTVVLDLMLLVVCLDPVVELHFEADLGF